MSHGKFGRRFLAALAGTTPAFSASHPDEHDARGRRFLAALAETTPAFSAGHPDEYRQRGGSGSSASVEPEGGPAAVRQIQPRRTLPEPRPRSTSSAVSRQEVDLIGVDSSGAFAKRLKELFAAAGDPTIQTVAAHSPRLAARGFRRSAERRDQERMLWQQRIRGWQTGETIPSQFETLVPVLIYLMSRAQLRAASAPVELLDIRSWYSAWEAAIADRDGDSK